jgi:predicted O-methyltransferase YrrM
VSKSIWRRALGPVLAPARSAFRFVLQRYREAVRFEVERLLAAEGTDLERQRQRLAGESTARFVDEQMAEVDSTDSSEVLLERALAQAPWEDGALALEFGVFEGASINFLADRLPPGALIHGFDSFEGLPQRWRDGYAAGTFAVDQLPPVRPNVHLVRGWFDRTLPAFLAEHPGRIAFLHVDCDLYSSAKTVLDLAGPRLAPGAVVVFDEYFNYPGWQQGEFRAFAEWIAATGRRFTYLGYNRHHSQVAVRIESAAGVA